MNCIFCKIVKDEVPSYTIYEDDIVKCFLDVNPDTNGHTLIIPKKHFTDLYDIDSKTINHIMDIAKYLGKILESKLHTSGLTLIQNNGDVQEVKHFHLHLKPYYKENEPLKEVSEVYEILKS